MSQVATDRIGYRQECLHAHGVDAQGAALFSRKIRRGKLLEFFATQPSCLVAMEACGRAHHWARELQKLGHEARLIPPAYVKPFIRRHKSDAIDAEAICEAAQRPGMRFVATKTDEQQAATLLFRTRDLLVRQRTQLINALRSHLTEYGWVAPRGVGHAVALADLLDDGVMARSLPEGARALLLVTSDMLMTLSKQVSSLDKEINRRAREDPSARHLMTIPGIGPIAATAILALAPPPETFRLGRDFAVWLGLTPLQRSTGGKQRLRRTSKMGERTLRRLLILGSSAVVHHASRRGAPEGSWLAGMLSRKPRMLITMAHAYKTARIVWAILFKQQDLQSSDGGG